MRVGLVCGDKLHAVQRHGVRAVQDVHPRAAVRDVALPGGVQPGGPFPRVPAVHRRRGGADRLTGQQPDRHAVRRLPSVRAGAVQDGQLLLVQLVLYDEHSVRGLLGVQAGERAVLHLELQRQLQRRVWDVPDVRVGLVCGGELHVVQRHGVRAVQDVQCTELRDWVFRAA
jgi:hypothetical protein